MGGEKDMCRGLVGRKEQATLLQGAGGAVMERVTSMGEERGPVC